MVYYGYGQVF